MSKGPSIEVIARAVLLRARSVLVCENVEGGYCYLPGGHVEFGEPAAAALRRELIEECGLRVRARALVLVTEGHFRTRKREHHEINLVFHVEQSRGGEPPPKVRSREPDIAFRWRPLASIRKLDLRPAPIRDWLAELDPRGERPGALWISGFPKRRG